MLSVMLAITACGDVTENDEDALYELTGKWYGTDYTLAFEITQDGEGYIAASKTEYAVSVSGGGFVRFRNSGGTVVGSFNYSIKNGQLTMTLGSGDFKGLEAVSPFVKAGTIPPGGGVPVELIGTWYAKTNPPASPNFEIYASGAMTISGSATSYTAIVQGNKVSVLEDSVLQGEFQYSFVYGGEMIVTNGTDICAGLAVLSPFVKKNG